MVGFRGSDELARYFFNVAAAFTTWRGDGAHIDVTTSIGERMATTRDPTKTITFARTHIIKVDPALFDEAKELLHLGGAERGISPEQDVGNHSNTPAVDLYGRGCCSSMTAAVSLFSFRGTHKDYQRDRLVV